MSTTLTDAPRTERAPGPRLLRGLSWLVARQHRALLLSLLAVMVLGSIWLVYERGQMKDFLDAAGWPEKELAQPTFDSDGVGLVIAALGGLPLILAVFVGAPLIAGDQEQGTAQLVTTQSVSRLRWVATKFAWIYAAVLVTSALLSALFTWWWKPYRSVFPSLWSDGSVFDNTGPMLPALCLFMTAAGITIGVLARRVLMSMAVTFVFAAAAGVVWDEMIVHLAPTRTLTYPLNADMPSRLDESLEVDRWIGSADGHLYGWGLCSKATEKASDACVKEHGIVDNVYKYLGFDQMPAMQWTGAGILLAGTVVLTAFVLWRVSRRPL
ncbi:MULTISPECIES: ABC transporter permease subunit [unclassified Streptomyces]|uniref:ABC transporter permease subunit n=1 Tax=unclassified Streptomyces TaxID=2593676 RepID=UPI002E76278C|nr:ABC transporter permease subunit [Streptomyces sp. JV190]MEE1840809.1 ABC transporter permease [Streptomyces sp. JV190]